MRVKSIFTAILFAASCVATPVFANVSPAAAEAAVLCCSASEVSTLRDLNYVARRDLKPPADVVNRLLVMSQMLAAGTFRSWNDPDRSALLGMMRYW